MRFKIAGAAALIMTVVAAVQLRAADILPPDVVASDTVAVIHLDDKHFNPDALQSAANAVLGDNAAKVAEPLKKFKEKFDKASSAGVNAITLVMGTDKKQPAGDAGDPPPGPGDAVMYLHLKAGADVKAIEAMITEDMPAAKKATTVFDQAGDYLAVHDKAQEFPVKPDATRSARFSEALATVTDAAVQIAFIPDEKTAAQILRGVDVVSNQAMKNAVPLVAKSKFVTVAIRFGDSPSLSSTINAATEADGKQIADAINSSFDDLKQQVANPGPNAGIMALAGPLLGQLIDGLRPVQNGAQVTVTLKTEAMKTIATTAAALGVFNGPQQRFRPNNSGGAPGGS